MAHTAAPVSTVWESMSEVKAIEFSVEMFNGLKRLGRLYKANDISFHSLINGLLTTFVFITLRTGLLNCLNARSKGLTFRHRASCI